VQPSFFLGNTSFLLTTLAGFLGACLFLTTPRLVSLARLLASPMSVLGATGIFLPSSPRLLGVAGLMRLVAGLTVGSRAVGIRTCLLCLSGL